MSALRLAFVLCAVLVLMACKDDPTQIILSIDTDYRVPAQLSRFHYEVFKRDSKGHEESRGKRDDDLQLLSKDDFPRTLAITSTHGREYAVRVIVQGFAPGANTAMVTREAIASFRKGRILSLPMNIVSACEGKTCGKGLTCGDDGQCEPIERSLHGWDGTPPRLMDGGMMGAGDGDSSNDAGHDAGPATGDAGDTDAGASGDGDGNGDAGTPIAPNDVIAGIALGMQHTCAWTVGGTVYCWGDNNHGALGDTTASSPKCPKGEPPCTSTPVEVPDIHDATKVVASEGTTCALRKSGHVYCWGFDGNGGLGTDQTGPGEVVRKTVQDITLTGVTDLAAGRDHFCALASGAVWCWGKNAADQLGTTSVDANGVGYAVASEVTQGATKLYPAFYGACVERAKQIECWGSNAHGELRMLPTDPNMDINFQATPVVVYTSAISSLSIGDGHVCAVESDAQSSDPLVCWGLDDRGQLGIGPSDGLTETCEEGVCSTTPLHVMGLASRPTQVMSGMRASCARFADTSMACWGSNFTGELAQPMSDASEDRPAIIQRAGANFTGITLLPGQFYGHVCVARGKREVWCWGDNYHGQSGDLASFGDNLYEPRRVPLPAP